MSEKPRCDARPSLRIAAGFISAISFPMFLPSLIRHCQAAEWGSMMDDLMNLALLGVGFGTLGVTGRLFGLPLRRSGCDTSRESQQGDYREPTTHNPLAESGASEAHRDRR